MNTMNKSIDDMMLSIESNNQTIDDMLNTAKENNARISGTMQGYANAHSSLNREQISAYADYAREYDYVKKMYGMAISAKSIAGIDKITNETLAYSMLDEVHTEQLTLMERLCSVLEKAGRALRLLCTE